MARIIVLAACALSLAGCTSWIPSFDLGSGGYVAEVVLESEPPGAEARTSLSQSCRTPCRLSFETRGDFTVTYSLEGFIPQSVPVQVRRPGDTRFDPGAVTTLQLVPNPVTVVLEAAPPPPKPVRRRAAKRPVAAAPARPAPARPAAVAAQSAAAPVAAAPAAPQGPRTFPTTMTPQPGATITPIAPAPRTN
jgi:hypothetical protein